MVFGLIFRPIPVAIVPVDTVFDLNYLFPVAIVPIFHDLFILVKENIDDGRIGSDLVAQFLTGLSTSAKN